MIKPLNLANKTTENKDKTKNKYHDPLNSKAMVMMSYSNEIGTAIAEIAPKLGAALWAPTFMYLGADIYDKYKNDKNKYNPSGERAFKRAVFQGLTSIVALPAAIILGQYIISPLSRLDKSGISGNAKEAIYRHTRNVIDQAHGTALENSKSFTDIITTTLKNKIKARKDEKNTINIFTKLYNKFFTHRYDLLSDDESKLLKFAKINAEKTFEILEAIKHDHSEKVPKKIYNKYKAILPKMKEMYKEGDYAYQASRNALKEYQTSLIFKNKLLKTLSGTTVLILLAKPINDFVDKQIMKKLINPGIDQLTHASVNNSRIKGIFNDMKEKNSKTNV